MHFSFTARAIALACLVCALNATLLLSSSMAATQGSSGATSTGTVAITASVTAQVQISGLSDVTFTNVGVASPVSDAQDVCVWSNTATGGYNITATGSGASSAFTLANSLLTVPYSVQWADTSGQTTGTGLTPTTAETGQTSNATLPDCGGGSSASLIISITAADLASMRSSTSYTGTLTLVVAPE
jgi:hypothetical protein